MSGGEGAIGPLRPASCLSDLALDQLLAGEADVARAEHLAGCPRCRGRMDELRRASQVSDSFIMRGVTHTRRRLWVRRAGVAASVALAAMVIVAIGRPRLMPTGEERLKGERITLGVYVRHGNGAVVVASSPADVAPRDHIRFEVTTGRAGHLCIVGVDGAGAVTAYVADGERLRAVGRGRQVIDGSIELDDTPGAERLIAVLCAEERPTRDVLDAARAALRQANGDPSAIGALSLSSCSQATFLLRKAPRPQ
jgi:hypothetical protein